MMMEGYSDSSLTALLTAVVVLMFFSGILSPTARALSLTAILVSVWGLGQLFQSKLSRTVSRITIVSIILALLLNPSSTLLLVMATVLYFELLLLYYKGEKN